MPMDLCKTIKQVYVTKSFVSQIKQLTRSLDKNLLQIPVCILSNVLFYWAVIDLHINFDLIYKSIVYNLGKPNTRF